MPKKNDMDKLLAREARRTNIVASIAGVEEPSMQQPESELEIVISPAERELEAVTPLIKSVVAPQKKEVRSVRKQVVFTPSLDKAIKKKCRAKGWSFNEVVNQLMENWVKAND